MKLALLFFLLQLLRVEGVITSSTGEPLDGARVILRREPRSGQFADYGTMTSGGGKFVFKDISSGRYSLSADMGGYISREYGQKRPNGPSTIIDLSTGQDVRDLKISLVPGGTIAGRIYDQEGRPMARASVQALIPRYVNGVRRLVPSATAQTDDLGEYRMFWMSPGEYYVAAVMGGFPRPPAPNSMIVGPGVDVYCRCLVDAEQFEGPDEIYLPTFYPNAYDEAGARALRLDPGIELRGVDFTLMRIRSVRVSGRVLDAEGTPVSGANVDLRSSKNYLGRTSTDNQGNFVSRRVPPGVYNLQAAKANAGKPNSIARQEIQVGDKDIADLELTVQPQIPMVIRGRVVIDGTSDQFAERRPMIALMHIADVFLGGSPLTAYSALVEPDGTFVLDGVQPGVFRLQASRLPENFYLRSARMGRDDVFEKEINLLERAADTLEVTIAGDAGLVEGVATDDNRRPTPGAQVVLVPATDNRSRFDLFRTATTDQTGRFTIENVIPGEYKLFAWEDLEPGAYFDPSLLAEFESRGTALRLEPNGRTTNNLTVIPAR